MAWSVSRACTSGSRSLLLSLAQPKTRNSRRALVTRAIRGGLRSAGPPARHLEQTMPRYFFNIRSGTEYLADEDGDECPSLQAAGKRAVVGAKELIAELRSIQRRPEETSFEITDERGRLALRIPFSVVAVSSKKTDLLNTH